MSPYRATDDQLDREIATLERIGRVRLRRASAELNEIDRELRELRRERARRSARASEMTTVEIPAAEEPSAAQG